MNEKYFYDAPLAQYIDRIRAAQHCISDDDCCIRDLARALQKDRQRCVELLREIKLAAAHMTAVVAWAENHDDLMNLLVRVTEHLYFAECRAVEKNDWIYWLNNELPSSWQPPA